MPIAVASSHQSDKSVSMIIRGTVPLVSRLRAPEAGTDDARVASTKTRAAIGAHADDACRPNLGIVIPPNNGRTRRSRRIVIAKLTKSDHPFSPRNPRG